LDVCGRRWVDHPKSGSIGGLYGTGSGVPGISVQANNACATLLVDLDVHPRVILRLLRHADQAVTMKIYANMYLTGIPLVGVTGFDSATSSSRTPRSSRS
jgi:hypothetical protein